MYIVVGYQGIQRAAITAPDGRYVVPDVPAGEPAAILGFHDNNYRYHNSRSTRASSRSSNRVRRSTRTSPCAGSIPVASQR